MKSKPIKNYPNYLVYEDGRIYSASTNRFLKGGYAVGYHAVLLYEKGKRKMLKVHRLVAEAFIPNPQNLPYVCHKNGICTDNKVSNLYWGTAKSNRADAIRHGTASCLKQNGENNHQAKLNNGKVAMIRWAYHKGVKNQQLSKMFGVSFANITLITQRKTWQHVK